MPRFLPATHVCCSPSTGLRLCVSHSELNHQDPACCLAHSKCSKGIHSVHFSLEKEILLKLRSASAALRIKSKSLSLPTRPARIGTCLPCGLISAAHPPHTLLPSEPHNLQFPKLARLFHASVPLLRHPCLLKCPFPFLCLDFQLAFKAQSKCFLL